MAIPPAAGTTPLLSPLRIGLLQSAIPITEPRWQGGIAYRPIASGSGVSFDPCGSGTLTTLETNAVAWEPWAIAVTESCATLGTDEETEQARALQSYQAQRSDILARTFWSGNLDLGGSFASLGWPNVPLAHSSAVTLSGSGAVGVVTAFGWAVQYLAQTLGGLQGMIHVEPQLLPYLAHYGVAVRVGNNLLTSLADHVVVSDTGYDGSSPTGSAPGSGRSWVYVTSMVRAVVSAPTVSVTVKRSSNDVLAVASGMGLAEWDRQAHAAIQVCIPDPGPACGAGGS